MSLVHASRRFSSRGACLRSSYAEISRFVTRHHGTTLNRASLCSNKAVRSFVSLQPGTPALSPEEKLRKTLDDFKESSMRIINQF